MLTVEAIGSATPHKEDTECWTGAKHTLEREACQNVRGHTGPLESKKRHVKCGQKDGSAAVPWSCNKKYSEQVEGGGSGTGGRHMTAERMHESVELEIPNVLLGRTCGMGGCDRAVKGFVSR